MLLLPDYRVRQRDYLLEISRALTSQLNLDEVLKLILEASVAMLAGSVGLIALREHDATFRTRATIGVDDAQIPLFEPLLDYIADHAEHAGQDFGVDDLNKKIRLVARSLDLPLPEGGALPMVIRGETVGVIFLFCAYVAASSSNDRIMLQCFADQAAIAVHNAQLYQSVSE